MTHAIPAGRRATGCRPGQGAGLVGWAVVILGIAVALLGPTAPSGAWAGDDTAPTVRLAVGEWPPYITESAPDGGPFLDRAVDVFEAAGYRVVIDWMPWNRALELTRQGIYDATLPWYDTEGRRKAFAYASTPVGYSEFVVFYRKDRFPDGLALNSFDAIAESGLVVAGLAGYFYEAPLKKRDVPLRLLHAPKKAWRVMAEGRADIFLEARKVGYKDIESFLGPGAVEAYGTGGSIRKSGMYVMFSRAVPNHAEMRAAWEDHAVMLTGTEQP
jgi:polar amino acid transport system substrate-binding protein